MRAKPRAGADMSGNSRIHALLSMSATAMLYAGLALLLLLVTLVILQVVCRNAFDLGLPWADELARFCGLGLVFVAIPRLLLDDKHIAMDMVADLPPRAARIALAALRGVLSLGFCGIILWSLYAFLLRAAKISTPALGIPNLVFYTPAILGFVGFAAVAAYLLHKLVSRREPSTKA